MASNSPLLAPSLSHAHTLHSISSKSESLSPERSTPLTPTQAIRQGIERVKRWPLRCETLNDIEKVHHRVHTRRHVERGIDPRPAHCMRCGNEKEHLSEQHGRELCRDCTDHMAHKITDAPGSYVVLEESLFLFTGPEDDGHSRQNEMKVKRGDVIFVKELARDRVRHRTRGKIDYPFPGWVSLVNTQDSYRKCCPWEEVTLLLHVERIRDSMLDLERSDSQQTPDGNWFREPSLGRERSFGKEALEVKRFMDAGQFEQARALLDKIIAESEGDTELHNAVEASFEELKFGSKYDKTLEFDYRSSTHGEILELRGLAVEEVRKKLGQIKDRLRQNNYSIDLVNPKAQVSKAPMRIYGQSLSVWAVILIQFVLYMCVNTLQPALFKKIAVAFPEDADSTYALALSFANVVKLGAPVVLGFISQRYNSRSAYLFTMALGVSASYACGFSYSSLCVALGYGLLQEGPPAIRCVRYIYMARRCTSDALSRLSQHATTVGLLGGAVGNLLAGLYSETFGPERADEWPDAFGAGSMTNIVVFSISLVLLQKMDYSNIKENVEEVAAICTRDCCERPVPKHKKGEDPYKHCCRSCQMNPGEHSSKCNVRSRNWSLAKKREERCDQYECNEIASEQGLCKRHLDEYALRMSFHQYKIFMTILFCLVQAMLEFGVNAVVITTFQPIVVKTFGWGASQIATVMLAGSILSFCVSQAVAMLAMKPFLQSSIAAGCYTASVFFFTWPPLSDWRIVIALILGLKAQILFASPFSSLYAEKIGKERLTQNLSTAFQLAPGIGGMLGAASAPFFLPFAGEAFFMLPALPVLASVGLLFHFRDHLGETHVKV